MHCEGMHFFFACNNPLCMRRTAYERGDLMKKAEVELLEMWDWEKKGPTGRSVARDSAHQYGIPHEGVHMWIIRREKSSAYVLLQQRSYQKTKYPGYLDITVGGHVPFGLRENKIQKEAFEEIGVNPLDKDLFDLGYYRYEAMEEGRIHREFQHVYLLSDDRKIDEYRFNDGEVIGIYQVPLSSMEKILETDTELRINGYNGSKIIERPVTRKDFHPLFFDKSMKEYLDILFSCMHEFLEKGSVSSRMPFDLPGRS